MTAQTIEACPECSAAWARHSGTGMTLVGYSSQPGHDHDDNCRHRIYACENGHKHVLRRINKCQTPDCGWVGKDTCEICDRPGSPARHVVHEWPPNVRMMTREEYMADGREG